MSVIALGHIAITTPRRAEWMDFAQKVLGMHVDEEGAGDGLTRIRMDDRSYRLEIADGAEEEVARIGWEVPDSGALDSVIDQLEHEGLVVKRCGADEAAERDVLGLAQTTDVSGFDIEFFYGQKKSEAPFVSPRSARFVTGEYGLGHVVLLTPVFDDAIRFYTEVLGFRVSDTMKMGPSRVTFMRCNARHHSLALVDAPVKGIHHFMVEVDDSDIVGRAYDICRDNDIRIIMDIGKHSNDEMFSFYAATPSGFGVEYGYGGLLVDDDSWTVTQIAEPSLWGHRGA